MKFIVDCHIPFIKGRLEPVGEVEYLEPSAIDRLGVADADALIIRTRTRCDSSLLQNSNVKFIATATIGTDHIDLPWCRDNGICVRNAPGCNAPGVAIYVWSSLLRGGFDLNRDTLGIIGYGHVGRIVAEWGERMGAKVLLNDPPLAENGFSQNTPLETLLAESDAVTLHVPMIRTGEFATLGLIGRDELATMKPNAILINASRGGVVDETAWLDAMDKKSIRGVVDTWMNEPSINPELLNRAMTASPHIAGYSTAGKMRATRMAIEATAEFFNLDIDTTGLADAYTPIPENISADSVRKAIEAVCDLPLPSRDILVSPDFFERARASYPLHSEPSFS